MIQPISKRRQEDWAIYRKVKQAWWRKPENHHCAWPDCKVKGVSKLDLHHQRGRSHSLLYDDRFFIALCREHHDLCKTNPTLARRHGMLCSVGCWNTVPK